MNCQTCNYPLWNIEARRCPECGEAFAPSQFSFAPGSVRFCCPECDQAYYGSDRSGHLVPRSFTCVRCHRAVDMDEMVLRAPLGGAQPQGQQTLGGVSIRPEMPWLERERFGVVRAWFRTAGKAMTAPGELVASVPAATPGSSALRFAAMNLCLFFLAGAVPGVLLSLLPGFGGPFAVTWPDLVLYSLGGLILQLVGLYIWFRLAHAVLWALGGTTAPERRTWQALGFASAAGALSAVPGGCLSAVGSIWWLVAAIVMLARVHGCPGFKAFFATTVAGLIALAPSYGLAGFQTYQGFANIVQTARTAQVRGQGGMGFDPLGVGLVGAPSGSFQTGGRAHAVQLLDDGFVSAGDFTLNGLVLPTHKVAGLGSLSEVASAFDDPTPAGRARRAEVLLRAKEAVANFPSNSVGHRVGDWIFLDAGKPDPAALATRWLAVSAPAGGGRQRLARVNERFSVIDSNGIRRFHPIVQWPSMVASENATRRRIGLPPLPADYSVWCDSEVLLAGE